MPIWQWEEVLTGRADASPHEQDERYREFKTSVDRMRVGSGIEERLYEASPKLRWEQNSPPIVNDQKL